MYIHTYIHTYIHISEDIPLIHRNLHYFQEDAGVTIAAMDATSSTVPKGFDVSVHTYINTYIQLPIIILTYVCMYVCMY